VSAKHIADTSRCAGCWFLGIEHSLLFVLLLLFVAFVLPSTLPSPSPFLTSRAQHGSPPARGGLGGGPRGARLSPHDRPSHTPRNARFLGRLREPFPETFQPPPNPPLAGGELVLRTLGSFWEAL